MAHYLIARETDDIIQVLADVEAKSIAEAIESLDLKDGESVTVYRMVAPPRVVRVREEVVRKVVVE